MTRRLALLRMLGLLPVTRYGSQGQMHRRPDQQNDPPSAAIAPTQAAGILRARAVLLFGTGNGVGLFEYSGTPALGNSPVAYAVPPGVTADPFGNTLSPSTGGFVAVGGGLAAQLAAAVLRFSSQSSLPFATPEVQSSAASAAGTQVNIISGKGTNAAMGVTASFYDSLNSPQLTAQVVIGPVINAVASTTTALLEVQGRIGVVDIASGDTNTYHAERLILTATGQLVNSLAATPVTGLAGIPVAAIPYLMRGSIIVDQGNVGVNPNQAIQVAGPAVSSMNITWTCIEGATIESSGVQTALNANLTTGPVPNNTTGVLRFDGRITFSASGLFGLEALCVTAAADTWTLRAGSWMELQPV